MAPDAAAEDHFGMSVDIDGDTVVGGAYRDDDLGASCGSAYVFVRSGSSWSHQAKLLAGDGAAGDQFGRSVGIEADSIVVGAHNGDDSCDTRQPWATLGCWPSVFSCRTPSSDLLQARAMTLRLVARMSQSSLPRPHGASVVKGIPHPARDSRHPDFTSARL